VEEERWMRRVAEVFAWSPMMLDEPPRSILDTEL